MDDPGRLGGLSGWVADVISRTGEAGVGLLVAAETIIPPVPSELVLGMAGYLASEGEVNLVLVVLAATAGSVGGALALYALGWLAGMERLRRWLDRLPMVDTDNLDAAQRWFARWGSWAVLLGRMVPVLRSLVSVPAGAARMPLGRFLALTTAGSGVWNSLFVGLGYALGSQWQQVERYGRWIDLAILATFVIIIARWLLRQRRYRRRRRATASASAGAGAGAGAGQRPGDRS